MAMNDDTNNNVNNGEDLKTCVVLGGRGLIGRSLVTRLLKLDNWIVRVADSDSSIQLDELDDDSPLSQALASGRASYFHVDVRNKAEVIRAIEGAVVVFYADTLDSCTHDFYSSYTIIVQGARNVVNACQECKVKRLIYNSPADIVFEIGCDIKEGDESLPYVGKFGSMLTDLKAQAEAMVLLANDIDGLSTCAIRSSNVFGPGDKQLVPLLVHMAKSGWSKFIVGTGKNVCEFTYVENVAHANACAEEALSSRMVSVSGKVFFITNLEPIKFSDFVSAMLNGLGYQRPVITLPAVVIKYLIFLVNLMRLKMDSTSVNRVLELSSCTRTLNCSSAQKYIGYSTVVSLQEGITLTVESFSHIAQDSITKYGDFAEQSKANKLLGNGKAADILLWRDEKKSFTCFLSLVLFYYWFFLCGRTFISSLSKLLLLIIVSLSLYGRLPSTVSGVTVPRVPSSYFEISEASMRNTFSAIGYMWNSGCHLVESLAQGEDWNAFIMIVALLYSFKLIASHSLILATGIALILAFNVFFIYEQYEEEIDGAVTSLLIHTRKAGGWLLMNLPSPMVSLLPGRGTSSEKPSYTFKAE
ncbi:3beta-hydroxysteroid-dehydrogenase/decarboxylase isoform X1 [Coffea arabica]|uniref:Reticulon-like protein n=1 Tax=Coffea arabica TaxID=13443 RepID=A0A6P6WY44_COFAR|nr:3beta-hydroxysteroid-dehydrogenase/decarboxylase-like isoform X1 [Coffea arabica]XP_027119612.1 3beta-hydroxysteroid-dehydrogenase/decarboxylase-like isoform X1 [Coffea arabica]